MIPALVLLLLCSCNAQWPPKSTGVDEVNPLPASPNQKEYPYDDVGLVQNIASSDLLLDSRSANPLQASVPAVISIALGNVSLSDLNSVKDYVASQIYRHPALRNCTDSFMRELDKYYAYLALDDKDNEKEQENAMKYAMSVTLRFLLEFYRIFRKISSQTTATQLRLIDVYGVSYDKAIEVLRTKKYYTPLAIAAPVRRSFDIFKSIIYETVVIVQTKCPPKEPNWACVVMLVAQLISESLKCSNVWFHAMVHLMAVSQKDRSHNLMQTLAEFDVSQLTSFDDIFDLVLDLVKKSKELHRVDLLTSAIHFSMIGELQERGALSCMSIDYIFN